MVRWNVFAATVAVVAGAAFVTGATSTPRMSADLGKPEALKPTVVIAPKTGYFNMAKVMREYGYAKTEVAKLTEDRTRMSATLLKWKEEYGKMQKEIDADPTGRLKTERNDAMYRLARKIEDEDRRVQSILNDRISKVISQIYDRIHDEVVQMAKEKGLVAVMAYPDVVTPEEMAKPEIKELKLKPPAAQPFYLDPSVDYSDEIIKRLNSAPTPAEKK